MLHHNTLFAAMIAFTITASALSTSTTTITTTVTVQPNATPDINTSGNSDLNGGADTGDGGRSHDNARLATETGNVVTMTVGKGTPTSPTGFVLSHESPKPVGPNTTSCTRGNRNTGTPDPQISQYQEVPTGIQRGNTDDAVVYVYKGNGHHHPQRRNPKIPDSWMQYNGHRGPFSNDHDFYGSRKMHQARDSSDMGVRSGPGLFHVLNEMGKDIPKRASQDRLSDEFIEMV